MSRPDLASGGFWLIFSLLAGVEAARSGLGDLRAPGPGFLPLVASVALLILSLSLLFRPPRGEGAGGAADGARREEASWSKIGSALGALVLYVALLETLGFVVSALLLIAFLLRVAERQRWPVVGATAVLATALSYLLFQVWLKVPLPLGVLGRYS